MPALAFLGTGIMRFVNMGLILLVIGGLIFGAVRAYNEGQKEEGREEVRTEINEQNEKLDKRVTEVNENINRRVINTTETINRNSREIEDVINDQPSEPISNVTKSRLERVREQQQSVSKTDR